MPINEVEPNRSPIVPLPPNIGSIQPGGGFCYSVELAWARLRRAYLKIFRRGYLRKMAERRSGDATDAPHPILDPRDLKFCSNQCPARWDEEDDPFRWRDRIPLARWGLCEVQVMGWPMIAAATLLIWLGGLWAWLAIVPVCLLGFVLYFFRDPKRSIPSESGLLVSPADGKVVEVADVEYDAFIDGPAIRIGIFLSIFNVHINRAPAKSRVIELRYKPGEFLNALNPESAMRNEAMWIGLESDDPPYRRMVVRQISGLIARRIVCALAPGQTIDRGERFGMIKLGSRTELILPREAGLAVTVEPGQRVLAGATIIARSGIARYGAPISDPNA